MGHLEGLLQEQEMRGVIVSGILLRTYEGC